MSKLAELTQKAGKLAETPAWRALERHARSLATVHLRQLLDEPRRFETFSRRAGPFLLDYSRQRVNAETMGLLLDLAHERNVADWIQLLFAGDAVNNTENRPALHMALRASPGRQVSVGGEDAVLVAARECDRMLNLAEAIRSGDFRGATGSRIRHVVNIGIGGSDLGIVMALEALARYGSADVEIHCVSNIDGTQLADVLAAVEPAETLFIVCSKSFVTEETALNADAARRWLVGRLGSAAVARHFIAISVNEPAMDKFGIDPAHRFRIWDWVGGRYSLWSSVGCAIAVAIGAANFRLLLDGGRALDEHFRSTPLADNLPVLMALLGVWNQNHLGTTTHAVLPYDGRLHRFAAYLQQLEMESNGKAVTRNGESVDWSTGTVIWGEPGSNAQHSFFQLLHQGTARFAADFIAPVHGSSEYQAMHVQGLANLLAQAEAFARGHDEAAVRAELRAKGRADDEIRRLLPHKVHPGNHTSSVILFDRLDPHSLGFLIALYEHKVFVQACVWGINPFDQWGVELGKQMATGMARALADGQGQRLPGLVAEIRARL